MENNQHVQILRKKSGRVTLVALNLMRKEQNLVIQKENYA